MSQEILGDNVEMIHASARVSVWSIKANGSLAAVAEVNPTSPWSIPIRFWELNLAFL